MNIGAILLFLFVAGFLGGVLNALAGGGSFITFAAMVFAGIPSILANATSSVALFPGSLMSAWAYRKQLPAVKGVRLPFLIAVSFAGSAVGAALLLLTPQPDFDAIVPWLLLAATSIFALGPRLVPFLRRFVHFGPATLLTVQFVIAIYGGYFGGGLGVMLLAILGVLGIHDMRAANVLKNLLATAVSAVTIAIFVLKGIVDWPHTLVMLAGAACGGFLGGWLVRVLPPAAVRAVVIAAGTAITLYYAWRYWL